MSDSSRLEAFSDAVFGFALTLLVVALEVPDTFDELAATMRGFVAFAASFAVLYWIWYEHQRFFRRHPLADGVTLTLNAVLLFVVLFYVYPLKFMFTFLAGERVTVTTGQSRLLLVVYGLGFAAVFAIFALMYRHGAGRARAQGRDPGETRQSLDIAMAHTLSMGVGLVSVGMALVLPLERAGLAGFLYVVLGPLHAWHGIRSAGRSGSTSVPGGRRD